MKKLFKLVFKIFVSLLFIAMVIQVSILTIKFGSGHWVTMCTSQKITEKPGGVWNSVYFTTEGKCHNQDSSEDTLKYTIWVKDPWSFNLSFLNIRSNILFYGE